MSDRRYIPFTSDHGAYLPRAHSRRKFSLLVALHGQACYYGLQQMFVTRRAVYVLACDANLFGGRRDELHPDEQLEEDIRKLHMMKVCQWLQTLSWRILGCDVILVATKCDLVQAGKVCDTAYRIEKACRTWLSGLATPLKVNIDGDIALTSCEAQHNSPGVGVSGVNEPAREVLWDGGSTEGAKERPAVSLIHRLTHKHGTDARRGETMAVPRGRNIAVEVVDALREGR